MNDLPDRATIQADLAEKFETTCESHCTAWVQAGDSPKTVTEACPLCNGWDIESGRRYPFRAKCPCASGQGFWYDPETDLEWLGLCNRCVENTDKCHPYCVPCIGVGYIYAATLDTFRAAFRARGWSLTLNVNCYTPGDQVVIRTGASLADIHESVKYEERLTGMAALEAAAWRKLEGRPVGRGR